MLENLNTTIEALIPAHMQDGLKAYIYDGRPPGSFLRAVLENKLYEAFAKADDTNRKMMLGYAEVLENMPLMAWGGPEKVSDWISSGGLRGKDMVRD